MARRWHAADLSAKRSEAQRRDHGADLGVCAGAGEGNRTPTVGLGIVTAQRVRTS
jgi:hypothetical protein